VSSRVSRPAGAAASGFVFLGGAAWMLYDLNSTVGLVAVAGFAFVLALVIAVPDLLELALSWTKEGGLNVQAKRAALQAVESAERDVEEAIVGISAGQDFPFKFYPGAASDNAEESRLRAEIERLMRESARWGYLNASLFSTPPEPVIEWDGEGRPHIKYGRGSRDPVDLMEIASGRALLGIRPRFRLPDWSDREQLWDATGSTSVGRADSEPGDDEPAGR